MKRLKIRNIWKSQKWGTTKIYLLAASFGESFDNVKHTVPFACTEIVYL